MSTAIEQVTINGENDGRVVLGNAQIGAQLIPLGNTWTRIRLGMRIAFEDIGGSITGTPTFLLGVMFTPSGSMLNGPLTSNCTNFVGVRTNASTWTQASASVGAPVYYNWVSGSGFRLVHRASGSEQQGTTGMGALSTSARYISGATGSVRHPFIVDITKFTGSFSASIAFASGAYFNPDNTYQQLRNMMETSTLNTSNLNAELSGSYFVSSGVINCDESSGSLNSIVVGWSLQTSQVHISEFLWTRYDS